MEKEMYACLSMYLHGNEFVSSDHRYAAFHQ